MISYTCVGSVCGACDHKHRSLWSADRCCSKHHRAIQRGNTAGAYSDRAVRAVEDGVQRRLTWDEQSEMEKESS